LLLSGQTGRFELSCDKVGIALTAIAPDLLLAGVALALTGTVLAPSGGAQLPHR
jgi:hypothetical protein